MSHPGTDPDPVDDADLDPAKDDDTDTLPAEWIDGDGDGLPPIIAPSTEDE